MYLFLYLFVLCFFVCFVVSLSFGVTLLRRYPNQSKGIAMPMTLLQIKEARSRTATIRPVRGDGARSALLSLYPKLRLTTVAAYYRALVDLADNDAGAFLDDEREPFLVSDDALLMNTEPFIPVYDVLGDKQRCGTGRRGGTELVGLELHAGLCLVPTDALLAWR